MATHYLTRSWLMTSCGYILILVSSCSQIVKTQFNDNLSTCQTKLTCELKCILFLDYKLILPKYNIYNIWFIFLEICDLKVGLHEFYLELLISFGTKPTKMQWNVHKITLTGQTFECSAIYDPTFSFFLERDIQSSNASRACWPMPPSRWTKGISKVKITNLQP